MRKNSVAHLPGGLAALAFLLAACVPEPLVTAGAGPDGAACARRATVARQLAELHQYGGDMQGHIADLARQGASPRELAAYRDIARQIASVPMLAGDGGRMLGVETSLEELDLKCPA